MGSIGCGKKRCQVCVNVCETDTSSSIVTGEKFKTNHNLNCDGKCLIHLFTCECCSKPLGSLGYTRNEDCFQEHLFRHIHSGIH